MLHRQAVTEIHAGKPPAHPSSKKIVGDTGWQSAFLSQKCTLPAFYVLQKALLESHFGPGWPILANFGSIMAPKSRKAHCQTHQNQPVCVKITPKWGVRGILDRLKASSILFGAKLPGQTTLFWGQTAPSLKMGPLPRCTAL